MHEVGFEPTNSKRQDLKSCAFLWVIYLELQILRFKSKYEITDHFATHASIFASSKSTVKIRSLMF